MGKWISIYIPPALVGVLAGLVAYFYLNDSFGLWAGIIMALLGSFSGVLWATKVIRTDVKDEYAYSSAAYERYMREYYKQVEK